MQHNVLRPDSSEAVRKSASPAPTSCDNSQIKVLLRGFGLRTSLVRLKIIDALLEAARQSRQVGVRGVHAHLQAGGVDLSFPSVREVLKRLESDAVILLHSDKSYTLAPLALAILEQDPPA